MAGSISCYAGGQREAQFDLMEVLNTAVTSFLTNQGLATIDGKEAQTSNASAAVTITGATIDDSTAASDTTWSSSKIDTEKLGKDGTDYMLGDLDLNQNHIIDINTAVATGKVQGGSIRVGINKWELVLNGNDLEFEYNGTAVARLSTTGKLILADTFEIHDDDDL
jgi:hypothetical protein